MVEADCKREVSDMDGHMLPLPFIAHRDTKDRPCNECAWLVHGIVVYKCTTLNIVLH